MESRSPTYTGDNESAGSALCDQLREKTAYRGRSRRRHLSISISDYCDARLRTGAFSAWISIAAKGRKSRIDARISEGSRTRSAACTAFLASNVSAISYFGYEVPLRSATHSLPT